PGVAAGAPRRAGPPACDDGLCGLAAVQAGRSPAPSPSRSALTVKVVSGRTDVDASWSRLTGSSGAATSSRRTAAANRRPLASLQPRGLSAEEVTSGLTADR